MNRKVKSMNTKRIGIFAGILGMLNPMIGFAIVNFDLARGFSNPEIMLDVVVRPFWRYLGMPLFFITDILGWYVLPLILVILMIRRLAPRRRWFFVLLAVLYGVIGNYGAVYYAKSYVQFLATGDGMALLEASFLAYRQLWGTLNNIWGGVLFLSIGFLLFKHQERGLGSISGATGMLMLMASISYSLGFNAWADQVFVPGYLILFPVAMVGFGLMLEKTDRAISQGKATGIAAMMALREHLEE